MTKPVDPTPPEFPGVSPYLIVEDAAAAIDFYTRAFGARETMRLTGKGGDIVHVEMRIGQATIMVSREWPDMGQRSPNAHGGSGVTLCVFVPDVDAFAARAEREGAQVVQSLETKFYGDRAVTIKDPSGHVWSFMTHVEDVSPDEMQARVTKMMG